MRLSRIHTAQPLEKMETVEVSGPACHYLVRVLRLSPGDNVVLFNGDGMDYPGEIVSVQRRSVVVRPGEGRAPGNESPLQITLVQAISRGERMDYTLQKATELGVSRIQPLSSQRVEVKLDENRRRKRMAHWQGVVVSACEQSGRAVVPEVLAPCSLTQWLAQPDSSLRLALDPEAKMSLSSIPAGSTSVSVLVGPEGGLTTAELRQAVDAGVVGVTLGPRILRTETAGPAAIAVLQALAGDF